MLKALAKKNQTDFDADYKLPKILRNYKGSELCYLQIPGFSVDKAGRVTIQELDYVEPLQLGRASESAARRSSVGPPPIPPATAAIVATVTSAPSPSIVASPFPVNREWNLKWGSLIRGGANVVYTSLIAKRNPMNMPLKRQLILTDYPSLIYVDVAAGKVKGEVEWKKTNPPQCTKVCILVDLRIFLLTVLDFLN
jgi:hypothetical protein